MTQSISPETYAALGPIMASKQEKETQASSNALATAIAKGNFIKTSQSTLEHENLKKIRQKFNLRNVPQLIDLSENAKLVVPSSLYDGARNVTTTISPLAGDSSAYDSLKTVLSQPDFTNAAQQKGGQLGGILAALHAKTGSVSHGDFHLNNIRFDKAGTAYVIDIESLGNNFVDGHTRDANGFRDLVDLIAKTTSHMYKSGTYGANKGWFGNYFGKSPSKTEQAFAKGVFEGYIETASKEQLLSIRSQYEAFKKDYGSNVNRFLNGGWFSTYNNSVFQKVFQGNEFENLINVKLESIDLT
ncbi:MAG: hypothetical protein ACRYGR_04385 [Janthinobacterium lividum]